MTFKFHKTFEKDALADGATWEESWVADGDFSIKRVHVMRKTGEALTKSTFYFKIADRVFSREVTPASVLGPDVLVTPVLDIPFKIGEKLDFVFKNLEGAAIDVFVTFETHSA